MNEKNHNVMIFLLLIMNLNFKLVISILFYYKVIDFYFENQMKKISLKDLGVLNIDDLEYLFNFL